MLVHRMTLLGTIIAALVAMPALAQKQYGPGVSDTEIKIGQTIAYSGPASAYGTLGKVEAAYFKWLNETKGGINGRKITFISRDDAYSPPKAVENVRSLVESDEVALVFGVLGTPLNMAIRPYLNKQGVPQLFVAAGSSALNDPAHFPWTMGWQPKFARRGKILRQIPPRPQFKTQDRRALPERRFWQGLAERPQGRSRRRRRQADRQRAELSVD
jgi:branched-chain amino acid transport system substrate-binding protein